MTLLIFINVTIMGSYSLTEAEFNSIGKQAFIDWFRSIQKYTLAPHDNVIDVVHKYNCNYVTLTIVVETASFMYLCYDHTCNSNDGWRVLCTITFYKSSQSAQLVIDSFNKFIELEKIKLEAKPYGEDVVRAVEELLN